MLGGELASLDGRGALDVDGVEVEQESGTGEQVPGRAAHTATRCSAAGPRVGLGGAERYRCQPAPARRGPSWLASPSQFIVSSELIGIPTPEGRAADPEGVGDVLRASTAVQGLGDELSDLGVAALACLPEFSKRPLRHNSPIAAAVGPLTNFGPKLALHAGELDDAADAVTHLSVDLQVPAVAIRIAQAATPRRRRTVLACGAAAEVESKRSSGRVLRSRRLA